MLRPRYKKLMRWERTPQFHPYSHDPLLTSLTLSCQRGNTHNKCIHTKRIHKSICTFPQEVVYSYKRGFSRKDKRTTIILCLLWKQHGARRSVVTPSFNRRWLSPCSTTAALCYPGDTATHLTSSALAAPQSFRPTPRRPAPAVAP